MCYVFLNCLTERFISSSIQLKLRLVSVLLFVYLFIYFPSRVFAYKAFSTLYIYIYLTAQAQAAPAQGIYIGNTMWLASLYSFQPGI
jgi:hypothetical protein